MPRPRVHELVQRSPPPAGIGRRRHLRLPLDQVHPEIRIAHHLYGPVSMAHRIIYDHELVLVLDGSGETHVDGRRFPYEPGTLVLIPPFVPHHQFSLSGRRGEHIAVHFDWRRGVPGNGADPRRRHPYGVQVTGFVDLPACWQDLGRSWVKDFQRVVELQGTDDPGARLDQVLQFAGILRRLVEAGDPAAVDDAREARLRPAFDLVHRAYDVHLDVPALARAAGMSRSRFSDAFRRLTGRSPMEYLRRYRVDRARDHLADSDATLADIAEATGFSDAFHLSKVFRKIDGRAPSVYRDQLRDGKISRTV